MKIVNIMNFVREIDERVENSTPKLLDLTTAELELVNEYNVDNTFLLQYDVLCNEDFVNLFKNKATEKTELGLWYEIVEPLATACNIPYRSERGWKWDWHIIPGFSMAYTPYEREQLIDEAMRKFYETFGYYPKTVASWLIDTHTLNYISEKYDISFAAICRDQANTDAYTLLGGYFNQGYYPSSNNIFTPAQTKENQTNIPVFRLLGPCPIHNYDNCKYSSEELKALGKKSSCFTLEPCWYMGSNKETVKWMFDTYFDNESLGFSYAQIGQENSFFKLKEQILSGLKMQIDMLLERGDVLLKKMSDTGELFKKTYPETTPATSVSATDNFDNADVQSIYYNCKNYTANLFRFEDKIFIRSLFLFDERVKDLYFDTTCTTFDAVYENLPIIDTMNCPDECRKECGLVIDEDASPFTVEKLSEGVLKVNFNHKNITFFENRIEIVCDSMIWCYNTDKLNSIFGKDGILFEYKGTSYKLDIEGATLKQEKDKYIFTPTDKKITLFPKKQ